MVLELLLLLAAGFDESFRAGLLALQKNDLKSAETHLEAASKLAPGDGRVWIALAQTYWKLGERGKADAAAAKAGQLGAKDALVQKSLSIYYEQAAQFVKAAEAAGRAGETRERTEELYFRAIQPLLQQQRFGEALPLIDTARARITGSAQLELARGVACYGLRRFDEAGAAFLATIAIAPEIDQPYLFLGRFLDQIRGRLPEVTGQFVNYERTHPGSATGYLLHAKALNAQSIEVDLAEELLRKSIAIDGRDASAHFELGVVYSRRGQWTEAAAALERSAMLDPQNPAVHYRLAAIYTRLGKLDAARAEREMHAKLAKAQEAGKY